MTSVPPLVSVIVPCYRVTAFIAEALDSLRAQTFRDFEAIVVNDGCPDTQGLERALTPFQSEIVYIRQDNHGLAAARNAGIIAARGTLIAFLDGDDQWTSDYLEVQVNYLAQHRKMAAVYPNAMFFGPSSWAGCLFQDRFPSRGDVTVHSLLTGVCRVIGCVTARRQAVLDVGMYDSDLRSAEDWDLWLRMAKAGYKLAYHDRVLYRYRLREGSLSSDKLGLSRAGIAVLNKFLKFKDLTDEERQLALRALRDYQAQLSFILGRIATYRGNRCEAICHLTQANEVMQKWRVTAAILILRVAPWLLYRIIHRLYTTEFEFLH